VRVGFGIGQGKKRFQASALQFWNRLIHYIFFILNSKIVRPYFTQFLIKDRGYMRGRRKSSGKGNGAVRHWGSYRAVIKKAKDPPRPMAGAFCKRRIMYEVPRHSVRLEGNYVTVKVCVLLQGGTFVAMDAFPKTRGAAVINSENPSSDITVSE
jgi:hypothetical protein